MDKKFYALVRGSFWVLTPETKTGPLSKVGQTHEGWVWRGEFGPAPSKKRLGVIVWFET
jgi:hypothetical protein